MTSVTLVFTDVGHEVSVTCSIPGGFDADSNACRMANGVMNFLDERARRQDHVDDVEIKTISDVNESKAQSLAHLASQSVLGTQ